MGVAPGAEVRIQPQVFVADIMPADPADVAVHHDHFAVIAEIELKTIARTLGWLERTHLHPAARSSAR